MAARRLMCAIEDVADWHPCLYLDPHVAAFAAIVGQTAASPCTFAV